MSCNPRGSYADIQDTRAVASPPRVKIHELLDALAKWDGVQLNHQLATGKEILNMYGDDGLIEGCHFRSPVFCFDFISGDTVRPQCFAKMEVCAGHWQVGRDNEVGNGKEISKGCTERTATAVP